MGQLFQDDGEGGGKEMRRGYREKTRNIVPWED